MLSLKNSSRLLLLATLFLLLAGSSAYGSSILWLGVDDHPNGDGVFDNMVLSITSSSAINVTGNTGGWQAMVIPNGDYSPYWDGYTSQLGSANIGNYLLGTGYFVGNPQSPNLTVPQLKYWGNSNGTNDSSVSFASASNIATTMTLELSGNAAVNSFGWYYLSSPNVLNQVFSGAQTAGATSTITTSGAPIGFYLTNSFGTQTTTANSGQWDEFQQSGAPAPEAMSFLLMAGGLGFIRIYFIRRRPQLKLQPQH